MSQLKKIRAPRREATPQSIFGNRVRAEREKAGLTQVALADRIGIKQASLSQIETGATENPDRHTKIALAQALNSDLGEESLRRHLQLRRNQTSTGQEISDKHIELAEQVAAIIATTDLSADNPDRMTNREALAKIHRTLLEYDPKILERNSPSAVKVIARPTLKNRAERPLLRTGKKIKNDPDE